MRFIVIDNSEVNVRLVRALVQRAFAPLESGSVWPADGTVYGDIDSAVREIDGVRAKGFDPQGECCVVFWDLALDEKNERFHDSVSRLTELLDPLMAEYVNIVLSLFAPDVPKELRQAADEVLDRRDIRGTQSLRISVALLCEP